MRSKLLGPRGFILWNKVLLIYTCIKIVNIGRGKKMTVTYEFQAGIGLNLGLWDSKIA